MSGFRWNPGDTLFAAAVIAGSTEDFAPAATLLGAADELRREGFESGEFYESDQELALQGECASASRRDPGFDEAYGKGQLLTMAGACDVALQIGVVSLR